MPASVRVPQYLGKVELEAAKKKRKKFPFQGFIDFQGLKIHVESRRGSYRKGKDKDGKPWSILMKHHYGEIAGTKAVDGDPLDVYVGPDAYSPLVVVVRQAKPDTGAYDEDKIMLGFKTEAGAVKAYKAQYNRPGFYGGHIAMPIGKLLAWCADKSKQKEKVAEMIMQVAMRAFCRGVEKTAGEDSGVGGSILGAALGAGAGGYAGNKLGAHVAEQAAVKSIAEKFSGRPIASFLAGPAKSQLVAAARGAGGKTGAILGALSLGIAGASMMGGKKKSAPAQDAGNFGGGFGAPAM